MKFLDALEERLPDLTVGTLTLHRRLVSRLAALAAISLFLFATIIYDAVRYGFTVQSAVPVFIIGVVAGLTLFSRISAVVWDEEKAAVSVAHMDAVGVAVLVSYYGFDIMLRAALLTLYPDADLFFVRGLILAGVFGAAVGRLLWFALAISTTKHRSLS